MPNFQPGDVVIANNLSNQHYTITNQRLGFVGIVLGYQEGGHLLVLSLSSDLTSESYTLYNQMPRVAYFHLKQAITRLYKTARHSRVNGRILIKLDSLFEDIPDIQKKFTEGEAVSLYPVNEDCFTLVPKQSSEAMLRSHLRNSPRLAQDLSMQLDTYHFGVLTIPSPKIFL